MDKLVAKNTNLWEVVDMQIEKGFRMNYKMTTLKEHLKMERANKERLLDRLNELSDEAFMLKHHQDIQGVKQDHKEDILRQ
jgi:heme oxygenase